MATAVQRLNFSYYIYIFGAVAPNVILPGAKFTLRPSLAVPYIGSVTAVKITVIVMWSS